MKRLSLMMFAALSAASLQAQNPSMATDLKNQYNQIKGLLLRAAEKMPDDAYSFQPVPEERNFGGWVAHVADSQARTCSTIAGAPKQIGAGQKTTKADLVAALKESIEICDPVYEALTDASVNEGVSMGRGGPRPKGAVLFADVAHDSECYGNMVVYMRLKGVVPPSSEPRPNQKKQ
jgi:uncharacterized damage-inducible protein DinB